MPDTIEGYVLGQTVTMRVGDTVGLRQTFDDYIDTFAGQEVEIIAIHDTSLIDVRTHNGIVFTLGRLNVSPALPKKRGRKPVERVPGEKVKATSITLPESDIAYLRTINPRNLSDAIRKLIAAHQAQG